MTDSPSAECGRASDGDWQKGAKTRVYIHANFHSQSSIEIQESRRLKEVTREGAARPASWHGQSHIEI